MGMKLINKYQKKGNDEKFEKSENRWDQNRRNKKRQENERWDEKQEVYSFIFKNEFVIYVLAVLKET